MGHPMTNLLPSAAQKVADAVGWQPPPDYSWTAEVCQNPLSIRDIDDMVAQAHAAASQKNLVLPGGASFLRRCILALITGHLVLQGPPGTGKTTLARILADAFDSSLSTTTATAEWSSFDVIGGMQPSPSGDGSLVPVLGSVSSAAITCAEQVRDNLAGNSETQAHWLLIDELNRADIDKAIGSLYTVLSQSSPSHLRETPLELWFTTGKAKHIWVPARFRLIGTMNDVDTSFVNTLSQGLTRRFQFVYLGVPTREEDIRREIDATWSEARAWYLEFAHGPEGDEAIDAERVTDIKQALGNIVYSMRATDGLIRWPIGSAQVLDVLRTLAVGMHHTSDARDTELLDESVADRMIPQAGTLDESQLEALEAELSRLPTAMPLSITAVKHLRDTRLTQ
jgi:MoxR-like ATPase